LEFFLQFFITLLLLQKARRILCNDKYDLLRITESGMMPWESFRDFECIKFYLFVASLFCHPSIFIIFCHFYFLPTFVPPIHSLIPQFRHCFFTFLFLLVLCSPFLSSLLPFTFLSLLHQVNHQYDKSSQFLFLAQQYVHEFLTKKVKLSSELSQLWELEISKIFCQEKNLRKFHPLFLSCNEPVCQARTKSYYDSKNRSDVVLGGDDEGGAEGLDTVKRKVEQEMQQEQIQQQQTLHQTQQQSVTCTEWCCDCEKCAFIYLLLSAWLPPNGK
jgi:hypothetical protein